MAKQIPTSKNIIPHKIAMLSNFLVLLGYNRRTTVGSAGWCGRVTPLGVSWGCNWPKWSFDENQEKERKNEKKKEFFHQIFLKRLEN